MNKKIFEQRREQLRGLMKKANLAALVISLDANRFYLSGFELHDPQINESAGRLVIMPDGNDWLCTDSRYLTAAESLWDKERIFIYRGDAMEQINGLLRGKVRGLLGFEARNISFHDYSGLSVGFEMQAADGMVEALRMIKDAEEIRRMEESCALNEQLMSWLPGVLKPGCTETGIAWEIEQFFRNHGAEELAFASIVAVDANAALPHAVPGEATITENCGVLVDVGCRLSNYCSDQTRSFWVGDKPDATFAKHLSYIQEAQEKAINAIRPGVPGAAVYAVAARSLEERGVLKLFTHGLGHGVGLQTHEAPSLGPYGNVVLKPGMVVTVEPGLYVPGKGGVRWEHMALVTEDGYRILGSAGLA